jgi:hypothetical protein
MRVGFDSPTDITGECTQPLQVEVYQQAQQRLAIKFYVDFIGLEAINRSHR